MSSGLPNEIVDRGTASLPNSALKLSLHICGATTWRTAAGWPTTRCKMVSRACDPGTDTDIHPVALDRLMHSNSSAQAAPAMSNGR